MTNIPPETTTLRPADVFLRLIVAFIAPMFLAATGGDANLARLAAIETVNAYAARNQADLLSIAQIIALGLGVLSSISLSMEDSLDIALILKLRGNAVSLNHAAERCRRVLRAAPAMQQTAADCDPDAERQHEEAALASLAQAEQRLAEVQVQKPAAAPTPPAQETPEPEAPGAGLLKIAMQHAASLDAQIPPRPAIMTDDHYRRTTWAAGMARVAREHPAGLVNLPPADRQAASLRATVLSSVARQLLSNDPVPPPAFKLPGTRSDQL